MPSDPYASLADLYDLAYGEFSDDVDFYENLARAIQTLLAKSNLVLDNPSYNFIIHTSPLQEANNDYYHWHLEIMPKLTKVAGFEWGTGFYINPTPPEESTKFLREALVPVTT